MLKTDNPSRYGGYTNYAYIEPDQMTWDEYSGMMKPKGKMSDAQRLVNRVMQEFAAIYDKCLTANETSSASGVRDIERKIFDYVEGLCEDINSFIKEIAEVEVKINTLKDETMDQCGQIELLEHNMTKLKKQIHDLKNPKPEPRKCTNFMAHVDLLIARIETDALDREFDDLDDEDLYKDYLSSRFATLITELTP